MRPTGAAGALRVAIGEDDVLLREGIARILTGAGLDVVAQAGDADDLLRRTLAHRPDVVIADVQMPPRREADGLVAAIELRRRLPETGVVILSQFCEPAFALDLIGERPEGVGYLLKERVGDVGSFLDAVARVAAGGSVLDPEVVGRMLGRPDPDDPLHVLTIRERAVLAAMARASRTPASRRRSSSARPPWRSTSPPSSASSGSHPRPPSIDGSTPS